MDIATFNSGADADLIPDLLSCCDVPEWAAAVLAGRPYPDAAAVHSAADQAARAFGPDAVDRALAAHPRIGERKGGDSADAAWSRSEQSGVTADAALAAANREYEARFGRVFLIDASGRNAAEIMAALRARLDNDDATEIGVVADQLRRIALRRLARVLPIDGGQEQA